MSLTLATGFFLLAFTSACCAFLTALPAGFAAAAGFVCFFAIAKDLPVDLNGLLRNDACGTLHSGILPCPRRIAQLVSVAGQTP